MKKYPGKWPAYFFGGPKPQMKARVDWALGTPWSNCMDNEENTSHRKVVIFTVEQAHLIVWRS